MNKDLSYYRRRLADERAAEDESMHPAVIAAHQDLAREYEDRIAALETARPAREMPVATAR